MSLVQQVHPLVGPAESDGTYGSLCCAHPEHADRSGNPRATTTEVAGVAGVAGAAADSGAEGLTGGRLFTGPWTWRTVAALPLLLLVRFYQLFISPLSPPSCRFYPSCSAYAATALVRFGPVTGGWLALRRLGRCHPWNPGGVDHVPTRPDLRRPRVDEPNLPAAPTVVDAASDRSTTD